MPSKDEQDLSFLICSTLDQLGFKEEMISLRAKCFDEVPKCFNRSCLSLLPIQILSVGSAGEGFKHRDSDIDCMVVIENIVCVDKGRGHTGLNVLGADYSSTAPGYTKVVLINTFIDNIFHAFHFDNKFKYKSSQGYPFIPSTLLTDIYDRKDDRKDEGMNITGPAVTVSIAGILPYPFSDIDTVVSFCFLGKHLGKWASRVRYFSWPSNELIREISAMEGYIVPIGDKQSDTQSLEWRICYTTAEKKLVSSLKNVHKKLYILLKVFAKRTLKPVCKAITSYVVKNVVFWIAEGTPSQQSSVTFLINLLQKSLNFIKHCLENNHLPNFMIPQRNLLKGSVDSRTKQVTLTVLSECLREGGAIITKIPTLYRCILLMKSQPDLVLTYGKWRDDVERQTTNCIILLFRIFLFRPELTSNSENMLGRLALLFQIYKITNVKEVLKYFTMVMPEFPNMVLRGQFKELIYLYHDRIKATMIL